MNKKIKRFSWIHELNEAAMEAKMIAEADLYSNQVKLNEAMGGGDMSDVDPRLFANQVMKALGPTRATTIKAAGGDPLVYRQEKLAKMAAERTALTNKRDLRVTDVDADGDADAEDVKKDAKNWEMGETQTRLPSFDWAHQEATPLSRVHPPAPNFGNMTANEITRKANEQLRADAVIDDLYAKMDAEIERAIKTAPPGKRYTIQDLQQIGRILGGR